MRMGVVKQGFLGCLTAAALVLAAAGVERLSSAHVR